MDLNKPPTYATPRDRARHLADERKRQARGAALAAACVVMVVAIPLQAWVHMLLMGALHSTYAAVATTSYGTSLLFMLAVNMGIGLGRRLLHK